MKALSPSPPGRRRMGPLFRRPAVLLILPVGLVVLAGAVMLTAYLTTAPPRHLTTAPPRHLTTAPPRGSAPASSARAAPVLPAPSPAGVCSNAALLTGPSVPPLGAVKVPAGDDSAYEWKPGTTYWFAPGRHTIGRSESDQIQPADSDTFIGAPGAILSGLGVNQFAFTGTSAHVTIKYLTIEDFAPLGNEAAVNRDSGKSWLISHATIQDNSPGAGVMMGSDNTVTYDCLTRNGQYGFGTYVPPTSSEASPITGGSDNITLSHNEISHNNTCDFGDVSPDPVPGSYIPSNCSGAGETTGCGCSGGGKFWRVENATVAYNYVHDNYDVGLWADTDNNGFKFENNYIADNDIGIEYEISYNAVMANNVFVGNSVPEGAASPGFPSGAIYISDSGGDSRVPNARGITTLAVVDNVFINNWSGVILWESADRFCGSPYNTSVGICTLVDPALANIHTCDQAHLRGATPAQTPDYYDLCRWKTQNVFVSGNTFIMNDSAVRDCKGSANSCGENGIFSEYGTGPGWSPYTGPAVEGAITASQGNRFSDNTYRGQWKYMYQDLGTVIDYAQWRERGQD
jgi:Right handed beta helix region